MLSPGCAAPRGARPRRAPLCGVSVRTTAGQQTSGARRRAPPSRPRQALTRPLTRVIYTDFYRFFGLSWETSPQTDSTPEASKRPGSGRIEFSSKSTTFLKALSERTHALIFTHADWRETNMKIDTGETVVCLVATPSCARKRHNDMLGNGTAVTTQEVGESWRLRK